MLDYTSINQLAGQIGGDRKRSMNKRTRGLGVAKDGRHG